MGLMGEPGELPYYSQTADEYVGVHRTGMIERRYTDVRLRPEDFTDERGALEPTPENIEWWDRVLRVLGDYQVYVLESPPEELDAAARSLGFASFEAFVEELSGESDLEREADRKEEFLMVEPGED